MKDGGRFDRIQDRADRLDSSYLKRVQITIPNNHDGLRECGARQRFIAIAQQVTAGLGHNGSPSPEHSEGRHLSR